MSEEQSQLWRSSSQSSQSSEKEQLPRKQVGRRHAAIRSSGTARKGQEGILAREHSEKARRERMTSADGRKTRESLSTATKCGLSAVTRPAGPMALPARLDTLLARPRAPTGRASNMFWPRRKSRRRDRKKWQEKVWQTSQGNHNKIENLEADLNNLMLAMKTYGWSEAKEDTERLWAKRK